MDKVVLRARDLDEYLTEADRSLVAEMDELYEQALETMRVLNSSPNEQRQQRGKDELIELYQRMGDRMQELTAGESRVKVYSFQTPRAVHGEASRLIAKLRDTRTQHSEFVYYIQRAYELLFNLAYAEPDNHHKNHLIVRTPVTEPVQNFAVHKIPDVDEVLENTVMCVMLRGALLPSMIMSKEIQEYTSTGYVTPFALFRISRDDSKMESNMEYIL
ncbi:MAG: uracil phosphoribosyltransferase, partial [Alkalispirochaeta sp.]